MVNTRVSVLWFTKDSQSSNSALCPGQEAPENKGHPEIPLSQTTLVGLGAPFPLGSVTARSEAQIAEDRSIS